MSSSSEKKYVLISSDGEAFEISAAAATKSVVLTQLINDTSDSDSDELIHLQTITSSILAKVLEYINKHSNIDNQNSQSKDSQSSAKLSKDLIDVQDSGSRGSHSSAKVSKDLIDVKDSGSRGSHSSAKISKDLIDVKDSGSKDCHSSTKSTKDLIDDKDSGSKDFQSSAKLTMNVKDSGSKDCNTSDEIDDKDSESQGSNSDAIDSSLKAWDAEFVQVDRKTLFDLVEAANYLNIQSLTDLTCTSVVKMMSGKTKEELREMFNIKNDFTPQEEDEIHRENLWVYD